MTGVRRYWNGNVLESHSNFLVKKKNLRITDLFSHPITKGVIEIVFPHCTFFDLTEEDVEDIIVTSEKAEFKYFDEKIGDVGTVPVGVVNRFYNGRCVTRGASDFLL